MTRLKFPLRSICLSLLMAICCISAFSQQETMSSEPAAMSTIPVQTIYFRNVSLDDPERSGGPFSTTVTGSIKGRVLLEISAAAAVDPQTVGGVRVILRALDTNAQDIVGEQISDLGGMYDFRDIQPGRYSIEIDPLSIPAKYRHSDRSDSTSTTEPF